MDYDRLGSAEHREGKYVGPGKGSDFEKNSKQRKPKPSTDIVWILLSQRGNERKDSILTPSTRVVKKQNESSACQSQ